MGCGCKKKSREFQISGTQTVVLKFGWELGPDCCRDLERILSGYREISEIRFRGAKVSFFAKPGLDQAALREELDRNFFFAE